MIKKKSDLNLRITNLDFLRGFFVVLALFEHYSFYLNNWYIENFKEFAAVKTLYASHFKMLGKVITVDHATYLLGVVFIPWVSQVYLALAAFNMAKHSRVIIKEQLTTKLKYLSVLLIIFFAENFIVSYDFGQAISIYPIMLWMIILIVFHLVYAFFGIRGMVVLTVLSLLRWLLPMEDISDGIELWVKTMIHPSFDYDARIEYFVTSGCIGFLLGYLHHQSKEISKHKDLILSGLGLMLVGVYFSFTDGYNVDPSRTYKYEHECPKTFMGSLFIWGAVTFVISFFIYLEKKNIKINLRFFNWIGINSLLVFLCHKIFFTRIIIPIALFVYAQLGWTLGGSFIEISIYVLITIFMCWLVEKFKIASLLVKN